MTKQEAQEIINRLNSNRNIEMPLCLLKSACETIVKQPEWQPIDSAPKDGTKILLLDDNICKVAQWFESHNLWGSKVLCIDNPTHWMVLPESPKEKK